MNKIAELYNTIFYIGYAKKAPGTIGSLFATVIIFFLLNIVNYTIFIFLFFILLILALIFVYIQTKEFKKKDIKEIIIDEFLGIYLIFLFFDSYDAINIYLKLVLIFLIFRFFDILKIFPAKIIDKTMDNSLGIILDDLIAAFYSIFILYLINVFLQ